MIKYIFTCVLCLCGILTTAAQELSQRTSGQVNELISLFLKGDKEAIALQMDYPFPTTYPIPTIETPKEFVKRFEQVFDQSIIKAISQSKLADWQTVGWRGTMLKDGIVWMDEKGKIYRVNQEAKGVNAWRKELMCQDKARLHTSVKAYEDAIALLASTNHLVRLDRIGEEEYRLSAWKKGVKMSEPPVYVYTQGRLEIEGSMANRLYIFPVQNEKGKIIIFLDFPGAESPEDVLIYYEDEAENERETLAKRL